MKKLGLRDKTQKKFLEFFSKMVKIHGSNEFELAYSDIQRETGSANVTLKRALKALTEDGIIKISSGRNSRYGKFNYLLVEKPEPETPAPESVMPEPVIAEPETAPAYVTQVKEQQGSEQLKQIETLTLDVKELTYFVENLRRRVRTQEMTIALLQDRLAELEDKLHKR
ncbi:hypothetical protein JCM15765_42940 [Paradesulfitobacterium aromaticivorans]